MAKVAVLVQNIIGAFLGGLRTQAGILLGVAVMLIILGATCTGSRNCHCGRTNSGVVYFIERRSEDSRPGAQAESINSCTLLHIKFSRS